MGTSCSARNPSYLAHPLFTEEGTSLTLLHTIPPPTNSEGISQWSEI